MDSQPVFAYDPILLLFVTLKGFQLWYSGTYYFSSAQPLTISFHPHLCHHGYAVHGTIPDPVPGDTFISVYIPFAPRSELLYDLLDIHNN